MIGPSARDPAKDAWVQRVLGVSLNKSSAAPAPGRASPAANMLPIWLDAKETIDDAISKLQAQMRDVPHPLLARVADQGLSGLTGRLRVGLQVALTEYDRAASTDRPTLVPKVQSALAAFRTFLDTDRVIPLLERNPFQVPVTIRATLGAALDTIDAGLTR